MLSILLIDVDHFKRVNDTYGHDAGDRVLTELGKFLKAGTRESDIVCRYGGEEFVIIMPEAQLEGAIARLEHLRQGFAGKEMRHDGKPLGSITISAGLAQSTEFVTTREALLQAADTALYAAKEAGRNRVVVADAA